MSQQKVLEAAKQGNPHAIAALMNRSLQPKGVTAKAKIESGCLQVMIESAPAPDQQQLVAYITKGVKGLEIEGLKSIVVYGRCKGDDFPTWTERVELTPKVVESELVIKPLHVEQKPFTAVKKTRGFLPETLVGKIWLATAILITLVVGSVVMNRLQPSPEASAFLESAEKIRRATEEAQSSVTRNSGITLSKYNQLETGMSYARAEAILGAPGEESARNQVGNIETVAYAWKNPDGGNIQAIFQNDSLVQKAQAGLK